jgi:hypothetical protein
MGQDRVRGWSVTEVVGVVLPNLSLGSATSLEEADAWVALGTHAWVWGQGGVKKLVPVGYELLPFESWLV